MQSTEKLESIMSMSSPSMNVASYCSSNGVLTSGMWLSV